MEYNKLEIHNIMRKGIPLLILLIMPIFVFAVQPAGKTVNEKERYAEVNSNQVDTKGDNFFLRFNKKVKQFKSKVKQFSERFKKFEKPFANYLFNSVFLFFSGLTIIILGIQSPVIFFTIIGLLLLFSSSIFSIVAFRRKKGKNFLVDLWFYSTGLPIFILTAIGLIAIFMEVTFF